MLAEMNVWSLRFEIAQVVDDGIGDSGGEHESRGAMGHRDTRILRRYQKVVDRLKREAAERLDELLAGPEH